ncbi:MAG: hypothetical protein ABEJ27_07135 [Halodesulfurarchaeum sp.]
MPESPSGLTRTRAAIALTVGRRDSLGVGLVAAGLYLVLYLVSIRALVGGTGRVGVLVADTPWSLVFQRNGTLSFEPIARIDFAVGTLLVSPVEIALATGLAILVGLNIALAYLAWRQPRACGVSPGVGVFAAVPALLSGSACCAPLLLIVLGLQASGLLLSAVDVLIPASVLLLLAGIFLVTRRINPAVVAG